VSARRWATALLLLAAASRSTDAQPDLRVRSASGEWRSWWRADRAPARWPAADATLAAAVRWRSAGPGLDVAELTLSTPGEGGVRALGRIAVVLVRLDPSRHSLRLDATPSADGVSWSTSDAPAAVRLALNAGQFTDTGPWGWVVHRGREMQAPAAGPLSAALVVAADGSARLVDATGLDSARALTGPQAAVEAVQSYPALLRGDGEVPTPLRAPGRGIDVEHRDARLAVGELRDGRLLFALTRFDGLGAVGDRIPLGLTVPETAALLGALGARRAMLLDGGLSAQLLVREAGGATREWKGMRRVPLGLVALAR